MKKRGDTTFGVACAAAVQATVFDSWLKLPVFGWHHIEMWREDDTALHFAGRRKAHEYIFTSGQHGLSANIEAGLTGAIDQQLGHAFLTADGWIVLKRGVDAGPGDQFPEQLGGGVHAVFRPIRLV